MTWEIFTPEHLSNPEYQERPEVSGSGLAKIYKQSPAHYKYQEQKETKALKFGIAAHSMILEPDEFNKEFIRGVDVEQYPDALVTQNDMKGWLKDRGQKVSGNKPELISRILELEPETHILDSIIEKFNADNEDKTVLSPVDYDGCQSMRETIMKNGDMSSMLTGGFSEYSLIGEVMGVKVKNRPDLITSAGGIIQYKTAVDCHPETFGIKVNDYGYLLKAALEWLCFEGAYNTPPKYYIWLVQEKEPPYIWKPYYLTEDALAIGKIQLETALKTYTRCMDSGEWPAYGNNIEPIQITEWLKREYNVGNE